MTSKQLLSEVRELTGDEGYVTDGLILTALNAALRAVYSELGFTSRACITLEATETVKRISLIRYTPGEIVSFPTEGVAFGFAASGKGYATVKDSVGERTYKFDGDGVEVYGSVLQGGVITFGGEYSYTVRDLCFFNKLEGGAVPSISERRSVRIDGIIDDYSSAVSVAENKNGMPLAHIEVIGNVLSAPSDFSGKVYFTYRKSPPCITPDNISEDLSLPSPAISAISALATAYALRSMDRDGSEFFFEEYERQARRLRSSGLTSRCGKYLDCTGWA